MNNIEEITNWFLNSRIYDNGAYVAYCNGNTRGPRYPEITAYAINLSCVLYKLHREKIFIERAKKCAQYMGEITKNGAVPSLTDGLFYVFDTGIFVSSLFDLYDVTEDETYLRQAQKSLDWMYSKWNGEQFSAVDKVPSHKAWFHLPSVHLAKMAIPLIKASVHLKQTDHEKTAYRLLEKYKLLQFDGGNFKVNEDTQLTMSHPHCYATEGFLFAYYYSKKEEYLKVAQRASDWLSSSQNKDGSLYREYAIGDGKIERTKTNDALSQASRIWKLLGVNQEGIDRAYCYLDRELKDGGLPLFRHSNLRNIMFSWRKPVFSWPTFFYLHSLTLSFGKMESCKDLF
jgi:uncharacterized protein YyaL (SSP411 family)